MKYVQSLVLSTGDYVLCHRTLKQLVRGQIVFTKKRVIIENAFVIRGQIVFYKEESYH